MFNKVLIANRGEIALRIILACKELGISTVAVYSEADRNSLHVRFADEDICIGPPESTGSYLNIPNIISAAEITGVDAVHPGYGFLSENANFAEICETCNIKFIGPRPHAIRLMGDKAEARRIANEAGVPIIPGSDGVITSEEHALQIAEDLGFPIILKAVAGGGGRGMRVVENSTELSTAFRMAQREAASAFGVPELYLEKYMQRPRHIEFQVLADEQGNLVHLGERECSVQRRHQKMIEESPSVRMNQELRMQMGDAALRVARAVDYVNAGTVEFLVDATGNFYFLEMNTRIQVEHPVTEMVTGLDLLYLQMRIAAGRELPFSQEDVEFRGHAIECRINAEDPVTFQPSPGKITAFHVPGGPGVRVDTAAYAEGVIPRYYDSMIAKVIVHAPHRKAAISRMKRALDMMIVEGIKTNLSLHKKVLEDEDFVRGDIDTNFMRRYDAKERRTTLFSEPAGVSRVL
ncbi:acetyl-CoA carboxylase biotin carboxylase subunit [bacterium]|nr:acetyl-CoA carboxylase biotin carboxylase subunit [bacterium]MCI0606755.1 acetyl-CoA carboxylase biotin carboxylase subunit [bacterium]